MSEVGAILRIALAKYTKLKINLEKCSNSIFGEVDKMDNNISTHKKLLF